MNILIYSSDKHFCEKVESKLFSSKLGHDLYTKILNETTSTYQNLAGFIPDVMICCAESFNTDTEKLIAKIGDLFPLCKIIIVTEKPDINFYGWAMENGIFKVIESKENIQEMIESSAEANKLVISEKAHLSEQEEREKFIRYAAHKIKCELLRYIMCGHIPDKNYYAYPTIIDFQKYLDTNNLCVTVIFEWVNIDDSQKYSLIFDIEKYISDSYFARLDIPSVFVNDSTLCFIVNKSIINKNSFCLNHLRDLIQRSVKGKYNFSIGVSQFCNVLDASAGFAQSSHAAMMSFYSGWNKIYYYESPLVDIETDVLECGEKILSNIREDDFESAIESLENMHKMIMQRRKYLPKEVTALLSYITLNLCSAYRVNYFNSFNLFLSKRFFTYQELYDVLNNVLDEVRTVLDGSFFVKTTNHRINNIIKYIDDNYADSKLSVSTIAGNNYISRNYLCTLFKDNTGMTVNAYIIKLRIEKSCQLLEEKNKKLCDIAFESGFRDPNYFSTVFKKQMGCSPTQYRIRKGIV